MTSDNYFITIRIKSKFKKDSHDLYNFKDYPLEFQVSNSNKFILNQSSLIVEEQNVSVIEITGYFKLETTKIRFEALVKKEKAQQKISVKDSDGNVAEFLKEKLSYCLEEVERVYKIVRWRFRFENDTSQLIETEASWCKTEENWNIITLACSPPTALTAHNVSNFENLNKETVHDLLLPLLQNEKVKEQIYHDMIREARKLMRSNYRSAYMIATSALEVAVKQYIITKKPDTEWLLDNLQSPNIHMILAKYIPKIDPQFSLSKSTLKEIQIVIEERNKLVHKGKFDFNNERVVNSIELINDIIYLIDYSLGFTWSINFQMKNRR